MTLGVYLFAIFLAVSFHQSFAKLEVIVRNWKKVVRQLPINLEDMPEDDDFMDDRPFMNPQVRGRKFWPKYDHSFPDREQGDPANQFKNYTMGMFDYKHFLHLNLFSSYRFPTYMVASGREEIQNLLRQERDMDAQFYQLPTGLNRFFPGHWGIRGRMMSDDRWDGTWKEPPYPSYDPWMAYKGFSYIVGDRHKRMWAREQVWFRNYYAFVSFINARAFTKAQYTHECYSQPDPESPYTKMTVVSKLVAMGEPYEVPCFTCSLRTGRDGDVTVFLRYPNRNPFGSFQQDVERVSNALFLEYTQTFYDTVYYGTQDKPSGKKLEEEMLMDWETGWPFVAERWREQGMTAAETHGTPIREPDGRLIIEPNPTMTNHFDPKWTAQSFVCAQAKNGVFKIEDFVPTYDKVLVNVDSLSKVINIQTEVPKTWKLRDFDHRESRIRHESSPELNLEIVTSWEPWSCCSGCCCKEDECDFPPSNCQNFQSYRTRRGYCAIKKIDKFRKITSRADETDFNWGLLNAWLSSGHYITQGIPCFSTLLLQPELVQLMDHLLKTYFSGSDLRQKRNSAKSLGLYAEAEECPDAEKLDCGKWVFCQTGKDRIFKFERKERKRKNGRKIPTFFFDDSSFQFAKSVEIMAGAKSSVSISVDVGSHVKARFKDTTRNNQSVSEVTWYHGRTKVPLYDRDRSPLEQRKLTSLDSKTLYIFQVSEEDKDESVVGIPMIGRTELNGTTILFSVKEGTGAEGYKTYVMIGGIIGGILLVGLGGFSAFKLWRGKVARDKNLKRKKLHAVRKLQHLKRKQERQQRRNGETIPEDQKDGIPRKRGSKENQEKL